MLVLSRRIGEQIVIGEDITIKVLQVRGQAVQFGISAARNVPIVRQEVLDRQKMQGESQATIWGNMPIGGDG